MLTLMLATALYIGEPAPQLPNFDGTCRKDYTPEQNLEVLIWRTDILLELINDLVEERNMMLGEFDEVYKQLIELKSKG